MKYFLLFFLFLVLPYNLYAPIEELGQFRRSLDTLTQFLSKPSMAKPALATYKELKKIVGEAYKGKNLKLLDEFEQTVAVKVAKYLLEELIKEGPLPENRQAPDYVPFVAYVTEKAVKRYPPEKTEQFNCISLAAGDLDNEFLLIRALRYIGYKTIQLAAIDIKYSEIKEFTDKFKQWSSNRGIPISTNSDSPIQNGVNLTLFNSTYNYIGQAVWHKFPKNHLLFMIQPGGMFTQTNPYVGYPVVDEETNELAFFKGGVSDIPYIAVYFPYEQSEVFIESHLAGKEAINKAFTDIINKSHYLTKKIPNAGAVDKELIARRFLLEKLIVELVEQNRDNFQIPYFVVKVDLHILFYDLIRATALDPKNPLAFKVGGLRIKELTDMSGSFQDVYNRYK